jgi:flagellin
MSSVINTNTASLVAQRNLSTSQTNLTQSVERLSSGLRINSAKDDAAGLGISQKLQSQITGANVSARNASDAISMVSTAEGGMQEVSNMLQRMRELATQGNNDSLNDDQRGYITTELNALRSEINQVGTRTTFNGKSLLNGSISGVPGTAQVGTAQVGTAQVGTAQVGTAASNDFAAATVGQVKSTSSFVSVAAETLTVTVNGNALGAVPLSGTSAAQAVLDLNADSGFNAVALATEGTGTDAGKLIITSLAAGTAGAISVVNSGSATFDSPTGGTAQVGTAATSDFVAASSDFAAASSDFAAASSDFAAAIAAVAGTGLQFQVGTTSADDTTSIGSLFQNVKIDSLANGSNFGDLNTALDALTTGGATSAEMGTLTDAIDTAIGTVAGYRSSLGAMSNRLDSNIANLQVQSENLSASMSRITDTDYAAETAQLSKNQVMQQAATAMLAQANQMPSAVLSLLQ